MNLFILGPCWMFNIGQLELWYIEAYVNPVPSTIAVNQSWDLYTYNMCLQLLFPSVVTPLGVCGVTRANRENTLNPPAAALFMLGVLTNQHGPERLRVSLKCYRASKRPLVGKWRNDKLFSHSHIWYWSVSVALYIYYYTYVCVFSCRYVILVG